MFQDSGLFVRIISALLAALLLAGIYWYFGNFGITLICLVASLLSIREFRRMLFAPSDSPSFLIFYSLISLGMILGLFIFKLDPLFCFSTGNTLFLAGMITLARERISNERLLRSLTLGVFGLFYCVLCPWLAAQVANLSHGASWFLLLLLVVFFGDTFAFFGGKLFGRSKLNPSLSPKKTVEGAIAGIFGSVLAAIGFWYLSRPDLSLGLIVSFGIVAGFVGQTGDLLMSLIKRVSQVKDSGSLMPGHGGVLDRIDGVLLVCPLIYTLATLVH